MNRIEQCDRCRYNTHNPHLFCTVHPMGIETATCPDFEPDPNVEAEELWEPEGVAYYNGELIYQPEQRLTRQQRLELLLWHPTFTGRCPRCGTGFPQAGDRVHWDCEQCGWVDDSA